MQFHYFALRKMHFLLHARALAAFPGGFGTFDELFELLTLIQTRKIDPIPVLLYGKEFWNRVVNFEALCEEGVISPRDLDIFTMVETAEEGWEVVKENNRRRRDAQERDERVHEYQGQKMDETPPLERRKA
jgi:predicted Rossmann-fold nucleotide-binding protein